VLAKDRLQRFLQFMLVFSVLTELGEHFSNIIHKKLGQLFIALEDKAEELAVIVVDNVG